MLTRNPLAGQAFEGKFSHAYEYWTYGSAWGTIRLVDKSIRGNKRFHCGRLSLIFEGRRTDVLEVAGYGHLPADFNAQNVSIQ